jgi:hypothetical protein
MMERHEWAGQRAELTPKWQRLNVECEALRDRLRQALPPHLPVREMDKDAILTTAVALCTSMEELAEVERTIVKLNEILGDRKDYGLGA